MNLRSIDVTRSIDRSGGSSENGEGSMDDAFRKEQQSLSHVYELLTRCVEALSLLQILDENNMQHISARLEESASVRLSNLTFCDLVVKPHSKEHVVDPLIRVLMGSDSHRTGLPPHRATALCEKLQSQCGHFFSLMERRLYETRQHLRTASLAETEGQRQLSLKVSADALKEAVAKLKEMIQHQRTELASILEGCTEKYITALQDACADYTRMHSFTLVVDVALRSAFHFASCMGMPIGEITPGMLTNGTSETDSGRLRGISADGRTGGNSSQRLMNLLKQARLDCYQCVLDTLGVLVVASREVPPMQTRLEPYVAREGEGPEEVKIKVSKYLSLALQSEDLLFHNKLYKWLLERGQRRRLLQVQSPAHRRFVEPFLRQLLGSSELVEGAGDNKPLLYEFYVTNRLYGPAANVMALLAYSDDTITSGSSAKRGRFSLTTRIDFLAHAISNSKLCTSESASAYATEQLQELQEKLEIARAQLAVLQALIASNLLDGMSATEQDRIQRHLLDVSDLYNDYAQKFNLHDCCLLILRECNHQAPEVIQELWGKILQDLLERGASPAEMASRIVELGTRFYRGDGAFVYPVQFLCKELEQLSENILSTVLSGRGDAVRLPNGWVIGIMRKVNVPFAVLLGVYLSLYEPTARPEWKFQIIASFSELITRWHAFAVSPRAGEYERGALRVQIHRLLLTKSAEFKGVLRTLPSSLPNYRGEVEEKIQDLTKAETVLTIFVEETPY
eukprot:g856.t1